MSLRELRKIGASDEINKVQEYVGLALRPLLANPLLDGLLLEDVELANGVTEVPHKLGRELRGWLIVRQDANASIWDSQTAHTRRNVSLMLNASAAVTVSIWVF